MPSVIFLNDKIVEEAEGYISTQDRGFLYGDGLFETLRAYSRKPFRLEDHVARLSNSSKHFDISFHYPSQEIRQIIEQLLFRNGLQDAYIRMTLSRGSGTHGLIPTGTYSPTFVIHTKPLVPYPAALYKTGVSLGTSPIRRSITCPLSTHKTLNYLTNYLVKKEAVEKGFHDAILLNTNGHVTECVVSNLFLVERGTVITPSLKANILPGITRKIILELCKENGIHASEDIFGLERVLAADEVFLTNSLMEVMPVSQINGQTVGRLVPGTVTSFLHVKYKALTHKNHQIRSAKSY
ncbi:MAG: aminodeoxychorismate lyase [Candidatus Brocadia sp. AMX2]|uniref:aminodeoxychorismate lyase n=1 Tax=Candidatus Brocadia sinica JPN1 TaxID=1197129 RepID=A0ABQ0JUL1_9BACT|nr:MULTISPECIES: aminodeoxychorismate lyase [Brocadia]KXK25160.1 MAG: branched-chain amino acid aminotransferase [Candidatus Brocadia sinica]MBC6934003.1 aminodeoxychorismate lyase [Candidatus Brocadia sp.]MBL1170218.1 aminodeoxychorismate lyase [Candidatus Brocadia sp. AMX1]NOG41726.1 aminodeoxychorismate lyase [Planctomycetota bacterium]KAA0241833.1 MAG: aminodeoxychorismate lyase [Candidatus Brocadia sp. AMX2]